MNLTTQDIILPKRVPDVIVVTQNGSVATANRDLEPGTIYQFEKSKGIATDARTILLDGTAKARRGYLIKLDTQPVISSKALAECGSLQVQVRKPYAHVPGSIGFSIYKDNNLVLIGNDLAQPGVLYHQGTTWAPGQYKLHVRYFVMPGMTQSLATSISWSLQGPSSLIDLNGKVLVLG